MSLGFVHHARTHGELPGMVLGVWSLFMRDPPRGQADLAQGGKPANSVGLAFLIAGVLWLWGARYLARDTELAPKRLNRTTA